MKPCTSNRGDGPCLALPTRQLKDVKSIWHCVDCEHPDAEYEALNPEHTLADTPSA